MEGHPLLIEDGQSSNSNRSRILKIGFIILSLLTLALLVALIFVSVSLIKLEASLNNRAAKKPKNLIFFLGDGFGTASQTMARICSQKGKLQMDPFVVGLVNTPSSSNIITDSAAGATAYSCALKTYNGAIAVDPWKKPCGTLLEAAKAKGMRTGIVVTSRLSHATPAAFSAHSVSRDYEDFIASQQVNQSIDVMFGGGGSIFKKYEPLARNRGYQIIHSAAELRQQTLHLPVLGLFADDHMSYEIDRNNELQPSLAEMTSRALDLLSQDNTEGFFLFVEGSRIDHAAHANDVAAHYHDILAFNEAWEVALNFAQRDNNTMVISTADHETGGLTLARTNETAINQTGPWPADAFPNVWYPNVITRINKSAEQLTHEFVSRGCPPLTEFDSMVYQYTGQHLTDRILNALGTLLLPNGTLPADLRGRFEYTLASYLSEAAYISWSTHGHSGVNVVLYAYNAELHGLYENVEIGQYLAKTFELNLTEITESLRSFVPVPPEIMSASTNDFHHPH